MNGTKSDDLARIFIRTNVGGGWGSYSLRDLLEIGSGGSIAHWFIEKIFDLVDLEEAQIVEEHHAEKMVALLEKLGVTIYRLK